MARSATIRDGSRTLLEIGIVHHTYIHIYRSRANICVVLARGNDLG